MWQARRNQVASSGFSCIVLLCTFVPVVADVSYWCSVNNTEFIKECNLDCSREILESASGADLSTCGLLFIAFPLLLWLIDVALYSAHPSKVYALSLTLLSRHMILASPLVWHPLAWALSLYGPFIFDGVLGTSQLFQYNILRNQGSISEQFCRLKASHVERSWIGDLLVQMRILVLFSSLAIFSLMIVWMGCTRTSLLHRLILASESRVASRVLLFCAISNALQVVLVVAWQSSTAQRSQPLWWAAHIYSVFSSRYVFVACCVTVLAPIRGLVLCITTHSRRASVVDENQVSSRPNRSLILQRALWLISSALYSVQRYRWREEVAAWQLYETDDDDALIVENPAPSGVIPVLRYLRRDTSDGWLSRVRFLCYQLQPVDDDNLARQPLQRQVSVFPHERPEAAAYLQNRSLVPVTLLQSQSERDSEMKLPQVYSMKSNPSVPVLVSERVPLPYPHHHVVHQHKSSAAVPRFFDDNVILHPSSEFLQK